MLLFKFKIFSTLVMNPSLMKIYFHLKSFTQIIGIGWKVTFLIVTVPTAAYGDF